ncbi:MAG: hypothetical protein KF760_30010 [Candidatus Eremiobacteraeota bacterium]|nr:hypothetical protein [Candidatus Eremiobacteraeota bacterium]MCW5866881.1 hypothetical protein [Candidatus Eremiobacteraeota bacterium]
MISKLAHLPAPGFHPSEVKKPVSDLPQLPADQFEAAQDKHEPNQHKGAKILVGLGMLAGGLGSSATALAADQAQVQIQAQTRPLANDDVHRLMISHFKAEGEVYKKVLGFSGDLTTAQAEQRLKDGDTVYVRLKSGQVQKISSMQELETLDTLQGQGLYPNLPPDLVDSLKMLEQGQTKRDGMYKPNGDEVTAFDAYRILGTKHPGAAGAAALYGLGGLAVGLGLAGAGALVIGKGLLVPEIKGKRLSQEVLIGAGIGIAALGLFSGVGMGVLHHQAEWPKTLEIRNGADSNLTLRDLLDVVPQANWLISQAEHPFTQEQQRQVLSHFEQHGGVYKSGLGHGRLSAREAQERLAKGKSIELPNPRKPGEKIEISDFRHLQEFDTVYGTGVNPVTTQDEMKSLRYLDQHGGFELKGKPASAYHALDRMLRDRLPVDARLNNKKYVLNDLREAQELNALKGDGINTILSIPQFQALQHFDPAFKNGDKSLDAFEALQLMHQKKTVGVSSSGRLAQVGNPMDVQQLHSLEVTGKNNFLPEQDYQLLQYWQQHGGYQDGRAYEALKSMEVGGEFNVQSSGRWAPARSFQDLQDLASFEAPDSPFPDSIPAEARDRLEYFQGTSKLAFRVGNREGRAYEGYRELRDRQPFDVKAGGVWNSVDSPQALHDLDAMLGRQVNDILPKDQYDLLHHLGDGSATEGLARLHSKANSYQALQAFRKGQAVTYDFVGGDFQDLVSIPVGGLDKLAETKLRRDNQKEYDKYRYSLPEFQQKMQRQAEQLPELAQNDLAQGQGHKRDGEAAERRGRSDLSDAQSDLSRARSDESWAQGRLIMAYAMPSENAVTKYRTVYDSEGNSRQESYTDYEHNYARDAAISSAQSDIWDAQRRQSRARSEISDAEAAIRRAEEAIRQAEKEISESQEIIRLAATLGMQVNGLNEADYQRVIGQLKSEVARMRQLSHTSSLSNNLGREGKLIDNMLNRPARPPGWTLPTPLAQ